MSKPESETDESDDILEAAIDEALEHEQVLAELRAALVDEPDPLGPAETEIAARIARRNAALLAIGREVLRHVLSGGSLVLEREEGLPPPVALEPPLSGPDGHDDSAALAPPPGDPTAEDEALPPPRATEPVPEQASPPASDPPTAPASAEALQELAGALGPNWERGASGVATLRLKRVIQILDQIGAPKEVVSPDGFAQQVLHVRQAARSLDDWTELPSDDQRELLALAVAKARYLQDEVDPGYGRAGDRDLLARQFKHFTRYSAQAQPGFVYGLTQKHRPTPRPTWLQTARHWWGRLADRAGLAVKDDPAPTPPEVLLDRLRNTLGRAPRSSTITRAFVKAVEGGVREDDPRLVRLAAEHRAHLRDEPALKGLRRAVRDADASDQPGEPPEAPLPGDWPWFVATRGKVAVVVGGVTKPEVCDRLRDAFGFADVEWDSDAQGRKLDGTADRIRNGSVGMVLFLARLASHRSQRTLLDACKAGGAPFIRMDGGYGVDGIRRQIEASVERPDR